MGVVEKKAFVSGFCTLYARKYSVLNFKSAKCLEFCLYLNFVHFFLRENVGKFDTLTLYFAGVKSNVESAQLRRHCSEALE